MRVTIFTVRSLVRSRKLHFHWLGKTVRKRVSPELASYTSVGFLVSLAVQAETELQYPTCDVP